MVESPSIVHTIETTVQPQLPFSYRDYRISLKPDEYAAARELYEEIVKDEYSTHIVRLEECRTRSWFARHNETGKVRVFTNSCKMRWCPLCISARRNWLSGEVTSWTRSRELPKFVTFTLKHSDEPLQDQFDRLYRCFVNVRRSNLFKRKVKGGVWFFQILRSEKSGQWHPHLHCILDAEFIVGKTLSSVWLATTGDSMVVDIKLIHDDKKAAEYCARYASSPASLKKLTLCDRYEIYKVLHGRRACGTFGSGRTIRLRPPYARDKDSWTHIGGWSCVTQSANHHVSAQLILKAWLSDSSLPAGINMDGIEDSIRGRIEAIAKPCVTQYDFEFYKPRYLW